MPGAKHRRDNSFNSVRDELARMAPVEYPASGPPRRGMVRIALVGIRSGSRIWNMDLHRRAGIARYNLCGHERPRPRLASSLPQMRADLRRRRSRYRAFGSHRPNSLAANMLPMPSHPMAVGRAQTIRPFGSLRLTLRSRDPYGQAVTINTATGFWYIYRSLMPHGFFTIEQWKPKKRGGKPQWTAVAHIDACESLSSAIQIIQQRNRPGFFRIIQTQRQVWAEVIDGKLKLRKWHAGSPKSLARTAKAFVNDKGRWQTKSR